MADRSTAAVDVASTNGRADGKKSPRPTRAGRGTADGTTAQQNGGERPADTRAGDGGAPPADAAEAANVDSPGKTGSSDGIGALPGADTARRSPDDNSPQPPDLHSGHRLAGRYRLEECVTRVDGFSSWRAVDEKLRRAVGIHLLPASHPRSRPVLAAARSAALLGDPRFVQVLDAVEDDEVVYVVHEWLPDATPLSALLSSGPMEPHEAYQLVSQLSQAMAAAHREGLAHLRLTPGAVLRTGSGQYRIRGLAVNAALRGLTSDQPQRADTKAIGTLLYAALTQRWPFEEDAYGLSGVTGLTRGSLVPPDQVRAGVHRGLSELAMRALVNDGATASRQVQPCAAPDDLAKAVAAMPRIRPPEPSFTAPGPYRHPAYQRGAYGGATAHDAAVAAAPAPAPPTLPGRTGNALKWGVSALLIAALGLGSWQLADALMKGENPTGEPPGQTQQEPPANAKAAPTGKPIHIVEAKDFDPYGQPPEENPRIVPRALDGDSSTSWYTKSYKGRADLGGIKPGVGLVLDLGKAQQVSNVKVDFVGETSADLLAAPESAAGTPTAFEDFHEVPGGTGTGGRLTLEAGKPFTTRYLLVWLTELPQVEDGYRGEITEVKVSS